MTLRDGAAMARARQIFGLTVDGMAANLGLTVAELRDVEDGQVLPIKTRIKIETALGFSLDDMFPRPDATSEKFTAQPYPLFLAHWSHGKPLVGRIVGWTMKPRGIPNPVVAFEDGGKTWIPITVHFETSRVKSGPS